MSYNTKNYTEQGGDKTIIGGTLEIKEDAIVIGLPSPTVIPAEYQAISTATTIADLKTDFNALLAKLIAAGFMATE